jgi:DNA-binding MurR/RpiR family transcriptional regulator
MFSKDTYLSIKRVEAKCECGKSFTVQSNLVKENSRMTKNLVQYIKFLLENPYNMTNEEMAAEAGVSEKTIRRARKGV